MVLYLQVIEYRDGILKDCNRLNRQWLKVLNSGYSQGVSFSSGAYSGVYADHTMDIPMPLSVLDTHAATGRDF